jgi:hypothetical protein
MWKTWSKSPLLTGCYALAHWFVWRGHRSGERFCFFFATNCLSQLSRTFRENCLLYSAVRETILVAKSRIIFKAIFKEMESLLWIERVIGYLELRTVVFSSKYLNFDCFHRFMVYKYNCTSLTICYTQLNGKMHRKCVEGGDCGIF